MKKSFISIATIAMLLMFSACGNKTTKSAADSDSLQADSVTADTIENKVDKHTEAYLRERVDSIYHSKDSNRDNIYCSTAYLAKYNAAAAIADERDEMLLDCDHWTNSQDDTDFTYKIGKISNMTDTSAVVKIDAKNFGKRYNVVLSMRYERDDWFVDDFISSDGTGEKPYFDEYVEKNTLYQRFSLNDLLYLTQHYVEKDKAEKSGLMRIYHDSTSDEDMDYDIYVYGRDVYKGAKKELGYELEVVTPHAICFSMSLDTSTNGRLNFANKDDANSFYNRASKTSPFNFEGKRIVLKKQPDGKSFLVEEKLKDYTSTMFAIHRPVVDGKFYMVEIEIYV